MLGSCDSQHVNSWAYVLPTAAENVGVFMIGIVITCLGLLALLLGFTVLHFLYINSGSDARGPKSSFDKFNRISVLYIYTISGP